MSDLEKLVVSPDEVAAVEITVPASLAGARLPPAMGKLPRILLAPLVFFLPLLCLATIAIWLVHRRKEPRVFHAWMDYCCILLVISGLVSSVGAGLFYFLLSAPAPGPQVPFALNTPGELSATASGKELSPRELASRVEGKVYIVSRDDKWLNPTRRALALSGFGTAVLLFADENQCLFATSRHVLDGENWAHSSPYRGEAALFDRAGGLSRAQIVGRHRELDLMLLRMSRHTSSSRFAQPILSFDQIGAGDHIMLFGHPEGLFFSLADGLVSRKDPDGHIQITAPVSPGASGGPVYDMHGRLLAIVSSMLDKRISPEAENLNFAVRADSFLHSEQWQLEPTGANALKEFATAATAAAKTPDSPSTPDP